MLFTHEHAELRRTVERFCRRLSTRPVKAAIAGEAPTNSVIR